MLSNMSGVDASNSHPIRIVARRTGLTVHVIRVWERRYGAVTPLRTCGGRRVYTEGDVERLILLRQASLAGHGIGSLARLPTARIAALLSSDPEVESPATVPVCHDFLDCCTRAVQGLDAMDLEANLQRARMMFGLTEWVDRLVVPLMHRVGDMWQEGVLRPAHEHLASAVVRTFLEQRDRPNRGSTSAPGLVVTTPSGQLHEIGALIVAAMASMSGWQVTYLGANLPAEEIALAARLRGAQAVALSIVYPSDDPLLVGEIERLRGLLGDRPVVVGGSSAAVYRDGLERIGVRVLSDLRQLREVLNSLLPLPTPGALPPTGLLG